MPNLTLYEQLEKSHRKTLREIAGDSDSWKRFLDSAGYTYRQSFKNQVAMYSQKPGMKAVLTEKRWEDMNRAVKGGTTGVRIFDDKSSNHISYVFDYADTVPDAPDPGPRPWTVYENKSGIALHNLLKRTGENDLDSYVRSRVQKIVDSEVDPGAEPDVRAALQRCLEQSAMYVTCVRLGLPAESLDTSAFDFPARYRDSGKTLRKMGTLLNHTLRACLEPVRSVAYSMNMTMPAPEEIAAQAKQPEPSAAPALPDLAKVPVRREGDTITIGSGEAAHEIDVTVSDEDHAAIAAHLPDEAKRPVKHHAAQGKPDAGYEQLSLDGAPAQHTARDYSFEYQLLDRLRTDCNYFLGAGSRSEKHLWAGSVHDQIAKMRELYDLLPEKPEWLTPDDISKYAQRMAPQYQVVVYHPSENGLDEKREYQTLTAAEHAAQKYLDGTMEGENGFAYEGTGVYDLQARRWVKTLGMFPTGQDVDQAAPLSRNVRADLEDVARLHDGYVQRMENGGILSPAEAADMDDLEDIQGRLEKELQQDTTVQKIVQEAEVAAAPQKDAADYAVEIPVDGEWTKFQTVQEAEHAAYQEWIKEGRKNAVNYSSTGDNIPSGGPKAHFQDNIAALRLLQYLDANGQQATPEQQQLLARYVGWGGIPDAFDDKKAEWAGEYKMLKELLPAQEYEAARASTLTSFYTPPEIIRTMYETLERFGLKGGNILEPSMGVGAFFANRPASFDTNGMLYGVELDPVTGRIAQQLYPKANIQITGYEKASLPDSFFDAVVGNVPFGQYKVNDPAFNRYNFLIHDYFAAKNIDKLRVGGIQAIITTSGTMDKKSEDVRRYLAARCDLIGAVRLPNTAFKAAAGTEVTADILFLQKRDGVLSNPEADWLHVGQTADGIPMNQYFIDHPEMICGKMEMVSGPYGPRPTCQPDTDTSLEEQLRTAMGRLQAVLPELAPLAIGDEENAASSKAIPADPAVRNYSYCVRDGKIYFRRDSLMWEQTPNAMTRQRIEGMVGLLSATRELIQAQVNDLPEEEIARLQRQLSRQYDDYVSKYGRLYSRANNAAFHEDSGYSLLRSLERVDEEGNFAGEADMFTKRTIRPTRVIDHVDTAAEALVVSLAEHGGIDLAYMQQLSGKTQEELVKDLSGLMFRVPGMGTEENPVYQTAEEYLSGNVRQKLEQARQAAALDPVYRANADALAAVQPKELTASEINVHLGTTWIPADDVRQFVLELMQPNAWVAQHIQVHYEPVTARWSVTGGRMDSVNVRATATYGTKRRSFYDLLQSSLNMQPARVDDYVEEPDGKKRAVPNVKETRLAQDKQKQIEAAFRDWIFKDPDRRRRLAAYYNEHYNNLRPREYDGSFLTFPGMNPEITLRPHQRNAVARILFGGNTLVAHAVGAGKTIVMGAAAMEKKRLGLCSKTMIVVPNHLTEQIGSELLTLYPNANILVAAKRDFEKDRRKLFCSRIATGNYDIVILGHSQFTRLPLSDERQQQFLRDEIEQFTEVINAAKKERTGQELSVKQLERAKKSLESRLEKLMDAPKDDAVTFEELGVDSLMVDEAHQFKNLAVQTKMQNVSGITTAESRKATDLLMKCQYLDEITGGKGVVFCTGTPISNSAAELYTMMRYIQADTLREHGLYAFDAWAANFGETVSAMELAPEGTGYRMKTRFARFNNLPELISMWKLAADVQTADMLKLEVPELEGGKPTVIMCPPTELQKHTIQALGERAEAVRAGSVDPHVDNMLKITTDGRKLALDQRLLNPALPDDPGSKANACADKVYEIWAQTREQRSTQLIFSDLATPGTGAWNVYDDIRDKLIARGVPKEEIAYIHDANTDAKKAALFARVRAGKVRVLLGSTQKMGAGTNVQTKLIALHHLDVPWRPSDIEQREGRILRQGNENKRVQIFRYATEGSFDAYSWQLIENKQRYISQIMTSKTPARSCEDLDEATLTYAEVKALCAGNPLIKEKMDLDNEVARLSTLRSAHNAQIYELQDLVSIGYPAAIRRIGQELDALRQDAALFQSSLRKDDKGNEMFSAVIQGVTYTKRADADAALLDACKAAAAGAGEKKIGRYCGFDICVGYDPKIIGFAGYLQGEQRYRIELKPKQNFSSFRAVLENISAQIPVKIAAREEIEKNIESAKEAAKQPFAYEEEFQTKLARLNELNILLDQEKQEPVQNKKENPMQKEEYQDLDEFLDDGKIVPANQLPAGWQWEMYNDGSGSLHGPNSERFYSYDLAPYATSGLIEYNATGKGYDTFEGSLDRFREWAEQQILQELKKEPLQYQEFLEHQSHQDGEIEKNPLDMEDAARQAGLTVQRDQDKPGAAYFDADQNVIHVSDAGSEEDVQLSELKGYADAVIQRTATVEQPVRDLESASLAVMLAARYDVGVSDRLSQQLASAHAEAVKYPTFDLPVTLQRLDKALDYCDHFLAHEQERALEQEAENEPEPEQETELSPQSQAFMMDL